jgi:alpha-tubulin suppressor-like RCC1 family protein
VQRLSIPSNSSALLLAGAIALVAACSDNPNENRPVPAEIRLISAAEVSGTPGWPVADSVVVEVLDASGNPLSGAVVNWAVDENNGGGSIGRSSELSDANGRAAAVWTLGSAEGVQTLMVYPATRQLIQVTVTATATTLHAASVTLSGGAACALTVAGQALCWGHNFFGQLGIATVGVGDSAIVPTPVSGSQTFSSLTSSDGHVCGLTADGAAWCWGSNQQGEAGTGSTDETVPVPTPVQTDLRFTSIAAGGTGFLNATCGLTASGEAWCWGDNSYAQLGNGTTESSRVPVRVQTDVQFASLWMGFWHNCAFATSGELWCWGEQEWDPGAFGAGPAGLHTTPVVVHPERRFTQLALGRNFTCGLEGQAAYCWGANLFGSLGNGQNAGDSPAPVAVIGGHSFTALWTAGIEETHGFTADGAVYRWGSPGNDVPQATPLLVAQPGFLAAESGDPPFAFAHGACGITAGNAVYCVTDDGTVRGVPASSP